MKRIIEISTPGTRLHLRHRCVDIYRNGERLGSVPLEDLGVIVLASPSLTVTSAVLGGLAAEGGVVVVAGADHQPDGVLLPLRAHTTRGERVRAQVLAKEPLRKRLWTALVRSKIENQAQLLEDPGGVRKLLQLAKQVRSGDPGNHEAQAARVYWSLLFEPYQHLLPGPRFRRSRSGEWPNNFLNYGYAVLRAVVARAICAAGLLPELGIHHHNRYDSFALASDLMEPFRPWVDHRCLELIPEGPSEIDRRSKEALLSIYDDPVLVQGEQTPLFLAVERAATTMAQAFLAGQAGASAKEAAGKLVMPSFRGEEE